MRSPPWLARTRYDLARVLIDRDDDGDRAEARRLLDAALGAARERAIEQIPELMGRILESQEEIRERESEMTPVVERYDRKLVDSKKAIENASSEQNAAEALVDYVEAYASRLEAQEAGLRSIEPAVVRITEIYGALGSAHDVRRALDAGQARRPHAAIRPASACGRERSPRPNTSRSTGACRETTAAIGSRLTRS